MNKATNSLSNLKSIVIQGSIVEAIHKNGKEFTVSIDGDPEKELTSNKWLKARLKYFNDHGTMEGY